MSITTFIEKLADKVEAYNEKTRNPPPSQTPRLDSIFVMLLFLTFLYLGIAWYKDYVADLPWSEVKYFYLTARLSAIITIAVHIIRCAVIDLKEGK